MFIYLFIYIYIYVWYKNPRQKFLRFTHVAPGVGRPWPPPAFAAAAAAVLPGLRSAPSSAASRRPPPGRRGPDLPAVLGGRYRGTPRGSGCDIHQLVVNIPWKSHNLILFIGFQPVDRWFIPLFIGKQASFWCRISSINSVWPIFQSSISRKILTTYGLLWYSNSASPFYPEIPIDLVLDHYPRRQLV